MKLKAVNSPSFQRLKDELFEKVWDFSIHRNMNIVLITFSEPYGMMSLGTRKLRAFISIVELKDMIDTRYSSHNAPPETVYNDFKDSNFADELVMVEQNAYDLSECQNCQVLVIVADDDGRKFIFASSKVKPYIVSSEGKSKLCTCLGVHTYFDDDSDVDH